MQESKEKDRSEDPKLDKRKTAATNDETLSDIEQSSTTSTSRDSELDPGPSPDGTLDERDELDETPAGADVHGGPLGHTSLEQLVQR